MKDTSLRKSLHLLNPHHFGDLSLELK
jgi:hypothetical protein